MEFHQIESVLAVVETGSFRGAAEKLHKAQSAVSHAVQSLEDQLGVKIFDRSQYRPRLTELGKSLYPQLVGVLQQVRSTENQAQFLKTGFEPRITLAVSALWPERSLVEVLQNFTLQFPFTELILIEDILSADELLSEGAVDLAISEVFDEKDQFEKRPLGSVNMLSVVSSRHPLSKALPPQPKDLRQHRQIVVKNTSEKSLRGANIEPGQPQIRVSTLNLKKQLILCGVGWGGLPQYRIESELKAGQLVALRRRPSPVPMQLAWSKKKSLGPGAQFLISALEAKKIKT